MRKHGHAVPALQQTLRQRVHVQLHAAQVGEEEIGNHQDGFASGRFSRRLDVAVPAGPFRFALPLPLSLSASLFLLLKHIGPFLEFRFPKIEVVQSFKGDVASDLAG